jgi:S1-C subfamily serine protease
MLALVVSFPPGEPGPGASPLRVGLPSGETVAATLVGRDPSTDLALLRAEATPTWAEADVGSA